MFVYYLALLLLFPVAAVVSTGHVFMERGIEQSRFIRHDRSTADETHELIFEVKQLNMLALEKLVLEISSPKSKKYQQWLDNKEVLEMTRNDKGADSVRVWLESEEGVKVTRKSKNLNFITATATIERWETILACTFYQWKDQDKDNDSTSNGKTGNKNINTVSKNTVEPPLHRALEYSLPENMVPHIAAVFNTVQVPVHIHGRAQPLVSPVGRYQPKDVKGKGKEEGEGEEEEKEEELKGKGKVTVTKAVSKPKGKGSKVKAGSFQYRRLQSKAQSTTLSLLNKIYKVGSNIGNASLSQSIFSTQEEYYSTTDLNLFQRTYGVKQQAAIARNGYSTAYCDPTGVNPSCYEGNLDMQYINAMAQDTKTIYWYVANTYQVDPFTAWAMQMSEENDPPDVSSASWGSTESLVSHSSKSAFNTQAIKLAAQGVTLLVATGDDGAPNNNPTNGLCLCGAYAPNFPASSPWVTAVGATQGPENGDDEVACQSQIGGVITSGGGFSNTYPIPDWQKAAVSSYFDHAYTANKLPVSGYALTGRGYPDLSLTGAAYEVIVGSQILYMYGTSASAPVLAGMISLINAERFIMGQPKIGFINPTLYEVGMNASLSAAFNDITSGHNRCCRATNPSDATCCTTGFHALTGWDPVTGWGSVNFPLFAAMFEVASTYTPTSASDDTSVEDELAAPTASPSVEKAVSNAHSSSQKSQDSFSGYFDWYTYLILTGLLFALISLAYVTYVIYGHKGRKKSTVPCKTEDGLRIITDIGEVDGLTDNTITIGTEMPSADSESSVPSVPNIYIVDLAPSNGSDLSNAVISLVSSDKSYHDVTLDVVAPVEGKAKGFFEEISDTSHPPQSPQSPKSPKSPKSPQPCYMNEKKWKNY